MASRPLRLCCLDGGGVKGLTSLLLLGEIFRALENDGHSVQPHEYFDLIGGTSTGGLIAIMLGRLHMSIDAAIAAYKELSPEIFKKKWWTQTSVTKLGGAELRRYWFEGKNLEEAVRKLLKQRELDVDMKLREADDPQCRVFVCAANTASVSTELLRSYPTRRIGHRDYDCYVWEAVRATSAAPLFFEPITLQASKATFVDGGVRANNPIDYLMSEARALWPGREVGCVVSLGTGIELPQSLDVTKSRLHEVLQTLADIATDATNKAREFRDTDEGRKLIKSKRYFRYSAPHKVGEVGFTDFESIPYMESITLPYAMDMDDDIEGCARALAGIPMSLPYSCEPVRLIRFRPNPQFVGRADQLAELRKRLFGGADCPCVAVHGLGGVGKTQIAVRFAYQIQDAFPRCSILWISAVSPDSVEQAYREIARRFQIAIPAGEEAETIKYVHEYLNRDSAGQWLLVADNVDTRGVLCGSRSTATSSIGVFPYSKQGAILCTTRTREMATALAGSNVILVDELSPELAEKLLYESLIDKHLVSANFETTSGLLKDLTYLPLAITQAAAYINASQMSTLSRYLSLLRATEKSMVQTLSRDFEDSNRYRESKNPVAATWLVSFQQIRHEEPLAADLLAFMACIEPIGILGSMLPEDQSPESVEFALGKLRAYSFIVPRKDAGGYDMHRLVHLAARNWMRSEGRVADAQVEATGRIDEIYPYPEFENREWRQQLFPHAQKLLRDYEAATSREWWRLSIKVGLSLYLDGRMKEAMKLYKTAERWANSSLPEDDRDRLILQHTLAEAYHANGQVSKAATMLEHVFKVQEALPEDHPDRLASQHALAGVYQTNGQVGKAVMVLEYVVKVEEALPDNHPSRLASQHALALAYQTNGQVGKAVTMLEHVIKVDKALAENHPNRLASQHALALAYRANDQVDKAVTILEYVVKASEALPEDHPDRLASQHALALAYQDDDKVDKAVTMLEHVVKVNEALPEDHPDRLASQHALANAYRANDQVDKAVTMLEYVVKASEALPEDHPDRLASQHTLALAYQDNDKVDKAVTMLEHIVKVNEALLEDHPDWLISQHALANAYRANNQVDKVVTMLEYVVKVKEALPEDYPDRLASQHALALAYQTNGQVGKAVIMLEYVVKVKEALSDNHPSRLASQHALAGAYRASSQVGKAVTMLEHVIKVKEALAEDHPDRLESQLALLEAYVVNKQLDKATELFQSLPAAVQAALIEEANKAPTSTAEVSDS